MKAPRQSFLLKLNSHALRNGGTSALFLYLLLEIWLFMLSERKYKVRSLIKEFQIPSTHFEHPYRSAWVSTLSHKIHLPKDFQNIQAKYITMKPCSCVFGLPIDSGEWIWYPTGASCTSYGFASWPSGRPWNPCVAGTRFRFDLS